MKRWCRYLNEKKQKPQGGAKGFMSGFLTLSLSTLVVKIIGLAFKIPMLSFLGTEGMGYFNSAYEIYALLCVIATAGLPVALSMMVSAARARGDGEEIKRVYRAARGMFLLLGVCGTAIMLALAEPLARIIGNPDAKAAIVAIAPALTFICFASTVRGYCQGFEQMTPTAVSQLIEALCKLGAGILFAVIAIKRGYGIPTVAAFAVLGITLGTLLSLLYLLFAKRGKRYAVSLTQGQEATSTRGAPVWRKLLGIALPITLGSAVIGLTRIIDMALIMRRLQDTGVSVAESNRIYGAYTTLAVPVFSLIPALIAPVSMALVPQLTSCLERGDAQGQRTAVENSVRITVLLALPASLGLVGFARPILQLLFSGQTEAVEVSAPLLSALGASVIFSCLMTTTNAVLQAYRKVYLPVISMAIGVLVKLVASYFLIGIEGIGPMGAPVGSLLCNLCATALNLYFMSSAPSCRLSVGKVLFKPLGASFLAVGTAMVIYAKLGGQMQSVLSLAIAIAAAVVLYLAVSIVSGAVRREDIELLPGGEVLMRYIEKGINRKRKISEDKNDGFGKEKDASREGKLHGGGSGNGS